jgi:hypothetical protein
LLPDTYRFSNPQIHFGLKADAVVKKARDLKDLNVGDHTNFAYRLIESPAYPADRIA